MIYPLIILDSFWRKERIRRTKFTQILWWVITKKNIYINLGLLPHPPWETLSKKHNLFLKEVSPIKTRLVNFTILRPDHSCPGNPWCWGLLGMCLQDSALPLWLDPRRQTPDARHQKLELFFYPLPIHYICLFEVFSRPGKVRGCSTNTVVTEDDLKQFLRPTLLNGLSLWAIILLQHYYHF